MVNPGHPSKGCMTCQVRKIQCDFARPVCRHCTKSGRVCLGYSERKTRISTRHMTDQRSLSSYSSDNPGAPDVQRKIETSINAVSLLQNLLTGTNGSNSHEPEWRYSFDAMATRGSNNVAIFAIRTIRRCLYSLRQAEQSFRDRRALFAAYSTTTSELRATLTVSPYSSALASAVFLFSLYEMIVNIDTKDHIWRIHLEGLLNILSGPTVYHQESPSGDFDTVHHAIIISKSEGDVFQTLATYGVESHVKVFLLLDVAKLCLNPFTSEYEILFSGETPRKLDVQKLRASIKHIQKNLKLFPMICPKAEMDISKVPLGERLINALLLVRWNDYHCLQLITASLLLSMGSFVHSGEDYRESREYSILSKVVHEAEECINSAVPVILETMPIKVADQPSERSKTPIGGFLVLWPLCCALKSPELSQSKQKGIQDILRSIGVDAFIPYASALANSQAENTKWTAIISGLLLIRVALSQEMRCIFSQAGIMR